MEFINADEIAKGLSSFNPESVAVAAGRVLLGRMRRLADSGVTFAVETTLSGRAYGRHVRELKKRGYRVDLLFLSLPSEELAVARVAQRVRLGGHNIPEPMIRRRYRAGLANFHSIYRPLVDSWKFYDTSGSAPRLVAHGCGDTEVVLEKEVWHNAKGDDYGLS